MSDLPRPEALFAHIDHNPPKTDWMDVPVEIKPGRYGVTSVQVQGQDVTVIGRGDFTPHVMQVLTDCHNSSVICGANGAKICSRLSKVNRHVSDA